MSDISRSCSYLASTGKHHWTKLDTDLISCEECHLDIYTHTIDEYRRGHARGWDDAKRCFQSNNLTSRQTDALELLLTRIGSWTTARWDQHLRNEVGDEDANAIIAWLKDHDILPYIPLPNKRDGQ